MFRRSLGKGYFNNAELDPVAPTALPLMTEPDEISALLVQWSRTAPLRSQTQPSSLEAS